MPPERPAQPKPSSAPDPGPPNPEPRAPEQLVAVLTDVATGRMAVAEAMQRLAEGPATTPMMPDRVTLDLDRQRRCGFPEVIYGDGKPAEMIAGIIRTQQDAGQSSFATRVAADLAETILTQFDDARFNPLARTVSVGSAGRTRPSPIANSLISGNALPCSADDGHSGTSTPAEIPAPHVAVITAGSTDAPVAEEAIETLHWMGIPYRAFDDIGVAGPARLLAAVPALRQCSAAIVIAGMEGALPAAVGGHLSVPVIAVPTSVGYGATLGGLTPMLGMLSSCASNVAVVNIDAGFKAAYLAGLMVRQLLNHQPPSPF